MPSSLGIVSVREARCHVRKLTVPRVLCWTGQLTSHQINCRPSNQPYQNLIYLNFLIKLQPYESPSKNFPDIWPQICDIQNYEKSKMFFKRRMNAAVAAPFGKDNSFFLTPGLCPVCLVLCSL